MSNTPYVSSAASRLFVAASVAFLAVLASSSAHAGLTVGATVTDTRANVGTSLTPSWNTTSGSLLTAVVTLRGTSTTTVTPPTVTGTPWTLVSRADQGSVSAMIYYIPNATNPQTGTQTWAISGTNPATIRLREYLGADPASTLDKSGSGTGTSGTAAVSTAALSQAAEFALVGIVTDDASAGTPTAYTSIGTQTTKPNGNPGSGIRITEAAFENVYTGAGTQSVSSTLGSSVAWGAVIATFKIPTKYWIGCTGNAFNDNACWSSTSGGPANTTAPGSTDDVVFDGLGTSSPVFPASTTTVNTIDMKPAYTGTLSVGTGKTLVINTSLAIEGGTFTGGGAVTFSSATLNISGGTLNGSGSAMSPSSLTVSGGTYNTGAGTLSVPTITMSGGAVTTGGTVSVSGAATISGGTFTSGAGTTTFNSLPLSGTGGVVANGGNITVSTTTTLGGTGTFDLTSGGVTFSGAVTVSGGTYRGTGGTATLSSTLAVNSGTFNLNGGGANISGAVTIAGGTYSGGNGTTGGTTALNSTLTVSSGTFNVNGGTVTCPNLVLISGGTYSGAGSSTFTRNSNNSDALQVSSGTFDLNGGTLSTTSTRAGVTIDGGTFSANGTTTIAKTLDLTAGTVDAAGGSLGVTGAVTVSGGTFKTTTGSATLGSTLAVSGTGTYDASGGSSTVSGAVTVSTGATYKIGSSATGQTLNGGMTISGGTLDGTSATGALKIGSGQTLSMSSGTLRTSTSSTAGPTFGSAGVAWTFSVTGGTVNISGGKLVGTTGTNGLTIAVGATITRLDYVDFANIPSANPGTLTYLVSITQATLSLRSTGCKFDYDGSATGLSNLKTVKLADSNTTVDVRAWFQNKDAATNGAAAGDAYDADDDTAPDDNTGDVNNKAVVLWTYAVASDTVGAVAGFPTAAFDWNTGAYYSTYVAFNDTAGANTTDRIYVRDTDGNPVSSIDITDANSSIVGTPLWTTESSVHVVYVATSAGKVYRYVDTNGTLTLDTAFASDTRVTAISSPLIDDGTNLYFGCTFSGALSVVALSKSTHLVVRNVGATASVTATPSWKISGGTTYLFAGSTYDSGTNRAYIYRIDMVPASAVTAIFTGAATSVGSSTRYVSGTLYVGDGNGKVHGIDALSAGFTNKTGFPYQDTLVSRHANNTVGAIQGAPWVDAANGIMFVGDNDGHLYKITTAGVLANNYPIRLTTTNQIRVSPIYISNSGVVVAGDSGGNVYYVDVKNASDAPALMYTTTVSGAVSTISYNGNTSKYMVGSASGFFEMLPMRADPTPTFVQ